MNPRREELEAWIAQTRRNQRKLAVVVALGAFVALGLMLWRAPVGGMVLGGVFLVGMCGFWVTSSHISDWHERIDELGRPRPVGRAGRKVH